MKTKGFIRVNPDFYKIFTPQFWVKPFCNIFYSYYNKSLLDKIL